MKTAAEKSNDYLKIFIQNLPPLGNDHYVIYFHSSHESKGKFGVLHFYENYLIFHFPSTEQTLTKPHVGNNTSDTKRRVDFSAVQDIESVLSYGNGKSDSFENNFFQKEALKFSMKGVFLKFSPFSTSI